MNSRNMTILGSDKVSEDGIARHCSKPGWVKDLFLKMKAIDASRGNKLLMMFIEMQ